MLAMLLFIPGNFLSSDISAVQLELSIMSLNQSNVSGIRPVDETGSGPLQFDTSSCTQV